MFSEALVNLLLTDIDKNKFHDRSKIDLWVVFSLFCIAVLQVSLLKFIMFHRYSGVGPNIKLMTIFVYLLAKITVSVSIRSEKSENIV